MSDVSCVRPMKCLKSVLLFSLLSSAGAVVYELSEDNVRVGTARTP